MSEATTSAPPSANGRDGLRVVLFGMPGAGKTSLLGALAQAAQTQEHLLHGRLTEPTPALAAIRHQVYDETTRPTPEEVVLYPVDFESFEQNGRAGERARQKTLLIDCDGRVANDLLLRPQAVNPDGTPGPLAQEVLAADALVLAVDASEAPSQIDADFAEFGRFLRLFERGRGQRSEVGGLPVFLVLTKCDLLAQDSDAPVDWVERIEEKKRQVGQRFRDFLARRDEQDGPLPFGKLDLHLWATAVKRPALAGSPARPREPYGVAELFRQAFDAARQFRQRRRASGRRLLWTVGSAAGLVVVLVAVTAGLFVRALVHRQGESEQVRALQNKVDVYRLNEGQTVAERLKGTLPQLRHRAAVLTEYRNEPEFGQLPPEVQEYVKDRLQELQAYIAYLEKLQREVRPLGAARSKDDLQDMRQTLETKLALPRKEWSQTEAARQVQERLEQLRALDRAVDEAVRWYEQLVDDGRKLWKFERRQPDAAGRSVDWQAWNSAVEKLLERAARRPFRDNDPVPGLSSLTYAETVLNFEEVQREQKKWEQLKRDLERIRDLSGALGLGGPLTGRPEVLVIPRKPAFTVADAPARLQRLQEAYPRYEAEFTLADLPEAIVPDIKQAAETNYRQLLESGREAVLDRLQKAEGGDRETLKRWRELQSWLANPVELRAWRVLASVLNRLRGKSAEALDPVSELATFLNRDRFELEVKRLTLEIPDRLRVRPVGPLTVYHQAGDQKPRALSFELIGEPQRDPSRRLTTYVYRPGDGRGLLTYQPGDELWAELPLRDADNQDWQFTWTGSRSGIYQFERLLTQPRLHRKGQPATGGEIADGVRLQVPEGQGGIPPLPDLLPVVRLGKR